MYCNMFKQVNYGLSSASIMYLLINIFTCQHVFIVKVLCYISKRFGSCRMRSLHFTTVISDCSFSPLNIEIVFFILLEVRF